MDGLIRLDNGLIAVDVATGRGAEIRFLGRPGGDNLLYFDGSDVPLRASRSSSYGSDELDWLSEYRGGWQELFPNAGAACVVDGVPLAFHGEASGAAWDVVDSGQTHAVLRTGTRLPLRLERRMRLADGEPVLYLEESAVNLGGFPVTFVWGHHPAFEAWPGGVLDVPDAAVHVPTDYDPAHNDLRTGSQARWPFVPGKHGDVDLRQVPEGPRERVVYLTRLQAGWAALRHPTRSIGVALAWDLTTFPHAWLWTEIGGTDFPWYGRSRIVALEPAAAWPNDGLAAALQRGQGHRLAPYGEHPTWLTAHVFLADGRPVVGVDRTGAVTFADTAPPA